LLLPEPIPDLLAASRMCARTRACPVSPKWPGSCCGIAGGTCPLRVTMHP